MTGQSSGTSKGIAFTVAATAATVSSFAPYSMSAAMTQAPPPRIAPSAPTAALDERLIDAKLAAVEARTETKFAQLIGEIRLLGVQISGLDKKVDGVEAKVDLVDSHARTAKATIIATVLGAAIGIVGLTFAAVAIFQSGMSLSAGAFQAGMSAGQQAAPAKK